MKMSQILMRSIALTVLIACASTVPMVTWAQDVTLEETIVYIECNAGGEVSRGSGVVVSAQGHVLTAKHVVPDGATCRGSLGSADPNTAARLVVQPTNLPVDATLLRFSASRTYDFKGYCALEDWMVRKRIIAAGYPGRTQTGAPSYREGILSTVLQNPDGVLETDAQTIGGMSGGPVFSRNLNGLVGIVILAEPDPGTGFVSYYGILPISLYAPTLGLTPAERPCYYEFREFNFEDPETGEWRAQWTAGDGVVRLGIFENEADCFIEGVQGEWNHPDDYAEVVLRDGEYVIVGDDRDGGSHAVWAKCIMRD